MAEGAFEVDYFSPPEFPEVDISVVESHGGPESYHFELLAPASVMPDARALTYAVRTALVKNADCKCT